MDCNTHKFIFIEEDYIQERGEYIIETLLENNKFLELKDLTIKKCKIFFFVVLIFILFILYYFNIFFNLKKINLIYELKKKKKIKIVCMFF